MLTKFEIVTLPWRGMKVNILVLLANQRQPG